MKKILKAAGWATVLTGKLAADHSGRDKTHGGQSAYEKMIFMASNKPII